MNLVSVPVVVGGIVLTVTLVMVAARVLGRRRGIAATLVGAVSLALCAGASTGATALVVNRQMGWITTPRALVTVLEGGRAHSAGPVVVEPAAGVGAVAPSSLDAAPPSVRAGTLPAAVDAHPGNRSWRTVFRPDGEPGELEGVVRGHWSGLDRSVVVWTPPGYSPRSATRYDVVVFLHGFPGTDHGSVESLRVAETFERLMAQRRMRPTLFVVPDLSMQGAAPDCVDIQGRPAVETFVTRDLVASIRTDFPNVSDRRSGWVLAGVSAGAYCAPVLYLRHRDEFFGAVALGGYDRPELGSLSRADGATREDFTISHMVAGAGREPVHLYLTGTLEDDDSVGLVDSVTSAERPGDRVGTHIDANGGHSWAVWARQFPAGIEWWMSGAAGTVAGWSGGHGAVVAAPAPDVGGAGRLPVPRPPAVAAVARSRAVAAPVEDLSVFGLRGPGTLGAALALAVALFGATLALAPHSRGWGRGGVGGSAARAALVALTCAAAIVAVVVVVNRSAVFFSSWEDLADNWGMLF